MARFRKIPIEIEAVQWTGSNLKEVTDFLGEDFIYTNGLNQVVINTLEGVIYASLDDFILRGVRGEHYPCKPDIFRETYAPVEDA
jgi:hypothetical protein